MSVEHKVDYSRFNPKVTFVKYPEGDLDNLQKPDPGQISVELLGKKPKDKRSVVDKPVFGIVLK